MHSRNSSIRAKKGFTGISALLLLIVAIVLGLVLVSYLINATDDMIAKSGDIKHGINENVRAVNIIEVAGKTPRLGYVDEITLDLKMLTSETSINLNNLIITLADEEYHGTLSYRDGEFSKGNDGYNTYSPQTYENLRSYEYGVPWTVIIENDAWKELPVDLDEDGSPDYMQVCDGDGPCPAAYDGTHMLFNISGLNHYEYAQFINDDESIGDISSVPEALTVTQSPIGGGYGYISITGTANVAYELGWNGEQVRLFGAKETLDDDLDDDGRDDYMYVNGTHVNFELSSIAPVVLSYGFGDNISSAPVKINLNQDISYSGTDYGTVSIVGRTQTDHYLDGSIEFVVTPEQRGAGYYVVEYLTYGPRPLEGRITSGDVVRIYAETYSQLGVDETLTIRLLYDEMESVTKKVFIGDTMPKQDIVMLYPRI